MLNEDFKDMLQSLLDQKVDFLLIGGYAMASTWKSVIGSGGY